MSLLTSWSAVPESVATAVRVPTINLSQQVELLKSQIVEQNAALARVEAERRREHQAAATSPSESRQHVDVDDPECNRVAKFIQVIQRRESNCSSSSDDSQSRQFF